MVERYRRGKGKQKLLGSHTKCWIWGRNPVLETLRAGHWPIVELVLSDHLSDADLAQVRELSEQTGTRFVVESPNLLRQRCHSTEHQGYVAKMTEFPYTDADAFFDLALKANGPALLVICDGLQDPYNFGAIIRSADAMNVGGIVIAERDQVGVTSMVVRSSAGAVNHVPIARVPDLIATARECKSRGLRIVGTAETAEDELVACDFQKPTAVVIGNEGTGIRAELLEQCDQLARIPMHGQVGSLNAAVSAGIVFYEVMRQRTMSA